MFVVSENRILIKTLGIVKFRGFELSEAETSSRVEIILNQSA